MHSTPATPDETTICRFRTAAPAISPAGPLLPRSTAQLDAKGLIVRKGTLMDATPLIASCDRPPGREAGLGAGHAQEPDADWTRKDGKAFFGYKAHLGVDQGSSLIRRVVLTSAKISESEMAEQLICGDERAVYGDKAYEQQRPPRAARRRPASTTASCIGDTNTCRCRRTGSGGATT